VLICLREERVRRLEPLSLVEEAAGTSIAAFIVLKEKKW
jgi:hypothetical protein